MAKKAVDFVNEARSKINGLETVLTEAHARAENAENKSVIENAVSSLESLKNTLGNFKD